MCLVRGIVAKNYSPKKPPMKSIGYDTPGNSWFKLFPGLFLNEINSLRCLRGIWGIVFHTLFFYRENIESIHYALFIYIGQRRGKTIPQMPRRGVFPLHIKYLRRGIVFCNYSPDSQAIDSQGVSPGNSFLQLFPGPCITPVHHSGVVQWPYAWYSPHMLRRYRTACGANVADIPRLVR